MREIENMFIIDYRTIATPNLMEVGWIIGPMENHYANMVG